MTLTAELGKLMCQESMGQTGNALEGFSNFVAEHPDHFLTPQALFGKARCLHALGRHADSKSVYENFISAHPDSEWTTLAESSLSFMEREYRKIKRVK